ncbi:MAG: hypothetical protein ACXWWE_06180, partial [Nitrospira sp.]
LYTFSFLTLLYFAVFSIVSARERRWFWATVPSKTFQLALVAEALTGTILTRVGIPGLTPLPCWQTFAIFAYAMVSCLIVNDAMKVAMIRRLVRTPWLRNRSMEPWRSPGVRMNSMSSEAARTVEQLRTGSRRNGRFKQNEPRP